MGANRGGHSVSHTHHTHLNRLNTDYCNRSAVHKRPPDYKEHLTVQLWQDTYYIGSPDITLKGWRGPESNEADAVELFTLGSLNLMDKGAAKVNL